MLTIALLAAGFVVALAWRAIRERSRRATFVLPEDAPPFGHMRVVDGASIVSPTRTYEPNFSDEAPIYADRRASRRSRDAAAPTRQRSASRKQKR